MLSLANYKLFFFFWGLFLFLHSYRNSVATTSRVVRYLSNDSNKVDEPHKVEEAETVDVPPATSEKVMFCKKFAYPSLRYVVSLYVFLRFD